MSIKLTLEEQLQNNLQGNLNKKFGMTLPVPFIENIIIDAAGENITVKAALYFNMDDFGDLNFDEFKESLEDVNFYAMMAFNREYTETSGSEMTSENTLTELIDGDRDVMSTLSVYWRYKDENDRFVFAYYPGFDENTTTSLATTHPNIYGFDPISMWEFVDTYYNTAGIPIKKLVSEVNIPVETFATAQGGTYNNGNFLNYIEMSSPYNSERDIINDVGIATFSTTLEVGTDADITSFDDTLFDDILLLNTVSPINPMLEFYSSLTSDLNCYTFFKDGSLIHPNQNVYVLPNGEIVENPILGLDLLYHYSDRIAIPDLIKYFKPLAGTSELDAPLQTMMDSLLTILETNGFAPDLLVKINTFLQSFSDKSSATSIGQFYGRVLERLTKANTAVLSGPVCARQVVNNPTVIDLRGTSQDTTYNAPSTEFMDTDYLYQNALYMNREYGTWGPDDAEHLLDEGSIFFNYETLLKEKSNIAQYFNVQKLENLFGSEALARHFYIDDVEMSPHSDLNDWQMSAKIRSGFSGWPADPNIPSVENMYVTTETATTQTIEYVTDSSLFKPCLYLRNFNLMNFIEDEGLNGANNGRFYKLMCFQFRHFIKNYSDLAYTTEFYYNFKITLRDSSNSLYIELYNLVAEIRQLLQEYYDLASEACSYNETDDFFNQFFIKGVQNYYSDAGEDAPWVKAAFMYTYMQDLWENLYDGVVADILIQSKVLSAQVSPEGGTLEALTTLLENYDDLFEKLFTVDVDDTAVVRASIYDQSDTYEEKIVEVDITDFPDSYEGDWSGTYVSDTTDDEEEEESDYSKEGDTVKFAIFYGWDNDEEFEEDSDAANWWAGGADDTQFKDDIKNTQFYAQLLNDLEEFWDNNRKVEDETVEKEYARSLWAGDVDSWGSYSYAKVQMKVVRTTAQGLGWGKIRLKLYLK